VNLSWLFLAAHGSLFDMERKRGERANAKDLAGPFIDREGYLRYIDTAEQRCREKLADEQQQ
jgi:hypothetical protein